MPLNLCDTFMVAFVGNFHPMPHPEFHVLAENWGVLAFFSGPCQNRGTFDCYELAEDASLMLQLLCSVSCCPISFCMGSCTVPPISSHV